MIVGSIKENVNLEKRVSITPETAKNIVALGLSVNLEKNYAVHLGIEDKQYEETGVNFYNSSKEVINNSSLILKVNCPTDEETKALKENTILIGIFNPLKNQDKLKEISKKKYKCFFARTFTTYLKSPVNGCSFFTV
jgi:NAD(P) transhydrogenase subunit alpha